MAFRKGSLGRLWSKVRLIGLVSWEMDVEFFAWLLTIPFPFFSFFFLQSWPFSRVRCFVLLFQNLLFLTLPTSEVCQELGIAPKITFIIVGKRHHYRYVQSQWILVPLLPLSFFPFISFLSLLPEHQANPFPSLLSFVYVASSLETPMPVVKQTRAGTVLREPLSTQESHTPWSLISTSRVMGVS